jgi:hypothetical protein
MDDINQSSPTETLPGCHLDGAAEGPGVAVPFSQNEPDSRKQDAALCMSDAGTRAVMMMVSDRGQERITVHPRHPLFTFVT